MPNYMEQGSVGPINVTHLRDEILHAEYRAYLCMMSDHGCECVALDYNDWLRLVSADW